LVVVALLVLVGCQGLPNPLSTPVPPDALHPNDPAQMVDPVPAPPDPAKLGELGRHRALWDSLRIRDYSMTVIYGCECGLAGRPIEVTVAGGQLASAQVAGVPLDLDRLTGFPATVDAMFEYGTRNANAGKLEFAWDERLGIPIALGVDPDLAARDDEIRIAVLDFAAAP
jgi:hypothetical protein